MMRLRLALARWILGKHCGCYVMGYHKLLRFFLKGTKRMKVMLHCTDKGVDVEADVLNHKKGQFLVCGTKHCQLKIDLSKYEPT